GRDLLGDGDEGDGERHLEHREAALLGGREEGGGERGHVEAGAEGERRDPGVVEPLEVGALRVRVAGHADPGGHDDLRAEQPRCRVLELADVRPGDGPVEPAVPGEHAELEGRGPDQVLHGQCAVTHGSPSGCCRWPQLCDISSFLYQLSYFWGLAETCPSTPRTPSPRGRRSWLVRNG